MIFICYFRVLFGELYWVKLLLWTNTHLHAILRAVIFVKFLLAPMSVLGHAHDFIVNVCLLAYLILHSLAGV